MNQHQRIMQEIERQYDAMREAVIVSPSALAHGALETFTTGEEDPSLQYAGLEHLKHMARVFLAKNKDPDSDESEAYTRQAELDLGIHFSGHLQDRYPLQRQAGQEPVYKLRVDLTPEERAYNVNSLRKGARARLEHADALEAEGALGAAA